MKNRNEITYEDIKRYHQDLENLTWGLVESMFYLKWKIKV